MNSNGNISLVAGADLAPNLRVKLTAGALQLAGLTDGKGVEVGTLETRAFSGQLAAVRARNHPGSRWMVANGAVTQYATVYTAAAGKVSATQGTNAVVEGIALTASGADGDLIEVLTDPA